MEYSQEKLRAFAIRRFQSVQNDETVGQTYEAIFGRDPNAEEMGKKLMKRAVVKETLDNQFKDLEHWSVSNVGQTTLITENNVKEWLAQAFMATPDSAAMDNPLCDVQVLKDGSKIPILPKKMEVAQMLGKILGMVKPDVNIQMNLPSWESTTHADGQRSWEPAEIPLLAENLSATGDD